jgi:hypothetical protein
MRLLVRLVLAFTITGCAAIAGAHHSWQADYDTRATIRVSGMVSEFLRMRPHSALSIEVVLADGQVQQWTVEYDRGLRDAEGNEFRADYFEPGEVITVTGQPHREESVNRIRMRSVVRDSDGKEFWGARGRRERNGPRRQAD